MKRNLTILVKLDLDMGKLTNICEKIAFFIFSDAALQIFI